MLVIIFATLIMNFINLFFVIHMTKGIKVVTLGLVDPIHRGEVMVKLILS